MMQKSPTNPLRILLESTKIISPTLISYDVGSLFELFVYSLLENAKHQFDKIILLSFYDAFQIVYQYWQVNLSEERIANVMHDVKIISVNSIYLNSVENTKANIMATTPTRLMTELSKILEEDLVGNKTILLLFIGLDMYGLNKGESDFRKLFSLLMLLSNKVKNISIATVINKNVFSMKTVEFLNSYSFNVAHLHAEVEGIDVRYYFEFKRVALLKYNLNRWEYKLENNIIRFVKKRVG